MKRYIYNKVLKFLTDKPYTNDLYILKFQYLLENIFQRPDITVDSSTLTTLANLPIGYNKRKQIKNFKLTIHNIDKKPAKRHQLADHWCLELPSSGLSFLSNNISFFCCCSSSLSVFLSNGFHVTHSWFELAI